MDCGQNLSKGDCYLRNLSLDRPDLSSLDT